MAKKITPNTSKREARETRRQQEQRMKTIRWAGLGLLALAMVGAFVWSVTRPASAMGDVVAVPSSEHVAEGTDSGPYTTDPPAGGKHYPSTYNAGFYDETSAEQLPKLHEGYLVHNLEHGYIIYWYNCQANPSINCADIKSSIKQVIGEVNEFKVIGFPWPSLKQPIVMTSWGRILPLEKIDLEKMRQFYRVNLNKSPEPDAD